MINSGENMEKRDPLYTVDENINWYSYGKLYGHSSKKFKTELPYYAEMPLLDMYLKEMKLLS